MLYMINCCVEIIKHPSYSLIQIGYDDVLWTFALA